MSTQKNSDHSLRVLLCVHQFFPEFSAGTEVLVLSTANALQAKGYVVRIATGSTTRSPHIFRDTYTFQGLTVYRISTPYKQGHFDTETIIKEYENPELSPLFSEILEEYKPDLVHFFHFKNLTLSSLNECLSRSIPTVFTPTDYWLNCRTCQLLKPWGNPECSGPEKLAGNCLRHTLINTKRRSLTLISKLLPAPFFSLFALLLAKIKLPQAKKLRRLSMDLANRKPRIFSQLERIDLLLPPTRSLQKMLLEGDLPPAKVHPLRYAIEPPAVSHELIATSKSSRAFTVGFIGTLVEHKGCHVLLSALKLVKPREMNIKIYGRLNDFPAYVSSLKAISRNDERVQFCGTFPPKDIGKILNELDVLVIPSTWRENAPLVLLNAIASGIPVIASNVEGITEYLSATDDVTLFPAGDAHLLAQLLDESCSTHSASHSSLRPAKIVAGNTLSEYANALDKAYNRLIQRPSKEMENI